MGCNSCNEDDIIIPIASTNCDDPQSADSCVSNKGKHFDKLIEQFTVPKVGNIGTMNVCQANLWAVGQWVGVVVSKTKYAFFKVTATGEKAIKVLNGCEKGNGESEIIGNPEPGVVIPEGTVIFPAPPTGCGDALGAQISDLIENYGCEAVINCLESAEEICFTSIIELQEEEEAHLFGGAIPEPCDCAPPATVSSCLRKLLNIFTGSNGKTFCFSDIPQTTDDDEVVNGDSVGKRFAYIDGKGCLKKGKLVKSSSSFIDLGNPQTLMSYSVEEGVNATIGKSVYIVNDISLAEGATHAILAIQIDGTCGAGDTLYHRIYAYYGPTQLNKVPICGQYVAAGLNYTHYATAVVPIYGGTVALESDAVEGGGGLRVYTINALVRVIGYMKAK